MADDPERLLQKYGYGDPRWLEPGDLADNKLHPPAVNQFALPPKAPAEVRNDSTRPDAYVDKNIREFMPPTVFAGSYGLGRTLGTAYGDLRMGDYANFAHALPEIAMAAAPMPGAKGPKLRPRELDKLGYYSQALEAAKAWPMEKGTPEQALAYLKKSGTKDAEIKATALDKYLAEQDGVVTRQGLEDYLRKNRVELQEGIYSDDQKALADRAKNLWRQLQHAREGVQYTRGETQERSRADVARLTPLYEAANAEAKAAIESTNRTKWKDYSLDPSNPTYRESVLHLPTKLNQYDQYRAQLHDKYAQEHGGGHGKWPMTAEERGRLEALQEAAYLEAEGVNKPFKSGHWDEPNVMAHARTSIQRDTQNRPVYLIDELQSDWGQKIREGGARDEAKIAEIRRRQDENEAARAALATEAAGFLGPSYNNWDKYPYPEKLMALEAYNVHNPRATDAMRAQASEYASKLREMNSTANLLAAEHRTATAQTPGHPLVNTTDQWTTTAIRRLLQDAAEKDAAGIALTPGALQNERFNLERHFSGADVTPNDNGRRVAMRGQRGDSVVFDVDPQGIVTSGQIGVGSPLGDVVGKELAERIMAQDKPRTLTGVDFSTGGQGMRYAYDQMYPKMLEKQLRKLDPEHPGRGQTHLVPSDFDPTGMVDVAGNLDRQSKRYRQWEEYSKDTPYGNPFHYFELTPRVKEEIKKGLPLFSLGALTTADLLRRYYGDEQ